MEGFKYIRENVLNYTMDEMSTMLDVSKQSIYIWENGKKKIPEKRLMELQKLTGIPKEFFLVEKLSETDKLEIKHYKLEKEINNTALEYKDQFKRQQLSPDSDDIQTINHDRTQSVIQWKIHLATQQLIDKIGKVIWQYDNNVVKAARIGILVDEVLHGINGRINLLSRFIDVVQVCKRHDILESILKALEYCYVDKNSTLEEDVLAQDIVRILESYKSKKLELLKKELEETKKMIDILENDNY